MSILNKLLMAWLALVFALAVAPSAKANTITVTNTSVVGGVFTYAIAEDAGGRIFEHASIPATVSKHFLGGSDAGTSREQQAETFLDLLGDTFRPDNDCVFFPKAMKG